MKVNVFRKTTTLTGSDTEAVFLAGRMTASSVSNDAATTRFLAMRTHQRLPFTTTVDANGGTATASTVEGYAGEAIGTLPTATRSIDYFEGWDDVNGDLITEETVMSEDVRTIKADYTDGVTVTFSATTEITGVTSITAWNGHAMSDAGVSFPTAAKSGDLSFVGWYTAAEGGTKVTGSTEYDGSFTTLYAQYSAQSYTVDLNGEWFDNTSDDTDPNGNDAPIQTNPDSSEYDGVYASYSNWNVDNGYARMYINIVGYTSFKLYIRSYAESGCDYTIAFDVDTDVEALPDYGTEGAKESTYGNQQAGMDISDYTEVVYDNLDGGSHSIMICFRKDSSVNAGNDRGYVLIPKNQ